MNENTSHVRLKLIRLVVFEDEFREIEEIAQQRDTDVAHEAYRLVAWALAQQRGEEEE